MSTFRSYSTGSILFSPPKSGKGLYLDLALMLATGEKQVLGQGLPPFSLVLWPVSLCGVSFSLFRGSLLVSSVVDPCIFSIYPPSSSLPDDPRRLIVLPLPFFTSADFAPMNCLSVCTIDPTSQFFLLPKISHRPSSLGLEVWMR